MAQLTLEPVQPSPVQPGTEVMLLGRKNDCPGLAPKGTTSKICLLERNAKNQNDTYLSTAKLKTSKNNNLKILVFIVSSS